MALARNRRRLKVSQFLHNSVLEQCVKTLDTICTPWRGLHSMPPMRNRLSLMFSRSPNARGLFNCFSKLHLFIYRYNCWKKKKQSHWNKNLHRNNKTLGRNLRSLLSSNVKHFNFFREFSHSAILHLANSATNPYFILDSSHTRCSSWNCHGRHVLPSLQLRIIMLYRIEDSKQIVSHILK